MVTLIDAGWMDRRVGQGGAAAQQSSGNVYLQELQYTHFDNASVRMAKQNLGPNFDVLKYRELTICLCRYARRILDGAT